MSKEKLTMANLAADMIVLKSVYESLYKEFQEFKQHITAKQPERIDSIIDLEKTTAEIDAVKKQLNELIELQKQALFTDMKYTGKIQYLSVEEWNSRIKRHRQENCNHETLYGADNKCTKCGKGIVEILMDKKLPTLDEIVNATNDTWQIIYRISDNPELILFRLVADYVNDGWKPDWNYEFCHYHIIAKSKTNKIVFLRLAYNIPGLIYFKSEQAAKDALTIFGEENFMKL